MNRSKHQRQIQSQKVLGNEIYDHHHGTSKKQEAAQLSQAEAWARPCTKDDAKKGITTEP